MTKQEKAKFEELESRIGNLESLIKSLNKTISDLTKTQKARTEIKAEETKTTKEKGLTVGNLIFNDKYVKTANSYINAKTRFAIRMTIENDYNGVKLGRGNAIYEKCVKEDKYVQVYEFKTVADCKKFMEAQKKRLG